MRRLTLQLGCVLLLFIIACAPREHREFPEQAQKLQTEEPLPMDPVVTVGTLSNGLTYYIRTNTKPEQRAELRLVVRAGSVLEDDDQQGLAHFVEHMAFNGTEHFEKHELVNYLESIGMQFGPDLNASTGFDETMYLLQVPTDSTEILENAFRILEDWAHGISFEDEEIEKERGVIIEEWRLDRGADARLRDLELPLIFHGSKYAERLPIGKREIIESFEPEVLRRFYRDWYRPDQMAVIAVGDFDPTQIEELIHRYFSFTPEAASVGPRPEYNLPGHDEMLFGSFSDPEATVSSAGMYIKHAAASQKSAHDYRQMLMTSMCTGLLTNRLDELTQNAEPPFLNAYATRWSVISANDILFIGAETLDNGIPDGFTAALTELERVRQYGFTETELEREKRAYLRSIEQTFQERDKIESRSFAAEYARHFITGEFAPGIEHEYALYHEFIPGITVSDLNTLAAELFNGNNSVVIADGPQKDGVTIPDEQELRDIIDTVANLQLEPYTDTFSETSLMETVPPLSQIVSRTAISELGVSELILENGIRVIIKSTDFQNEEILFTAFSTGGYSLVSEKEHVSATLATSIVSQGGIGDFSLIDLGKLLTGKLVNISPYIDELYEGFSGSVSPKDLETLFQLIHQYVYAPREDSTAYQSLLTRYHGAIENRSADPETAFSDTMLITLSDYHPRVTPWTLDKLSQVDLGTAFKVYRERFADTDDFTFVFVGNINTETFEPLVRRYLGSLPATARTETWRDLGIRQPSGTQTKILHRGAEQKSRVQVVFNGPFEWNRQNRYLIQSLASVMRIQLREVLREDLGGTYGVSVSASPSHYPQEEYSFSIGFGCDPDRAEMLLETVFSEIDKLRSYNTVIENIDKVKETQRRQYEVDLKDNSYWLSTLEFYYQHGEDPRQILELERYVKALTPEGIRDAANRYFDLSSYVTFILYPESFSTDTTQ